MDGDTDQVDNEKQEVDSGDKLLRNERNGQEKVTEFKKLYTAATYSTVPSKLIGPRITGNTQSECVH